MKATRAALLLAAAAALAAAAPAAHGDVESLEVDGGPHGPGDVISVSGAVDGAGEDRLVTIQVEGPGNVIAHREMVEAGAGGRFSASFAAGEPKYRWGDGAYQVRADHAGGRAVEVFVYFAAPPVPGAELQAAPAAPPPAPEAAGGRAGSGPGPLDWLPSEGTWGLPALAVLALAALAIPAAALAVWSRRRGARAQGRAAAGQAAAEGQAARAGAVPKQPEAPARAVPGQPAARPAAQAGAVPRPPAQAAPQKRAVPRQPAARPRAAPQAARAGAAPRPPERAAARAPAPAPPRPDVSPRRRENLLREAIPDGTDIIVIDSNAYIDIMADGDGASGWDGRIDERHHHRLAVPRRALGEVAGVLQGTAGHDATRLPAGRDMLSDVAPDSEFLRGLEAVHMRAVDDPGSDVAGLWLAAKARSIPSELGDPGSLRGENRKKALEHLYKAADGDREITAVAAAIAARDGKAYLVTSDGDMTKFSAEIELLTKNRLHVRRPEAAGAAGRPRGEGAEDGQWPAAPQRGKSAQRRYMVGKETTAILLGKSVAHPLAVILGGGDAGRGPGGARALKAVWEYVSAGGGAGRAGITEAVRGVVAGSAGGQGFMEGLERLLEAAPLQEGAENRQGYAEIVREIFRDEGRVRTATWAWRKRTYLKTEHKVDVGRGGMYSRQGGGRASEKDVRGMLLKGVSASDIGMVAEAMRAAEEREVVLVTDDGNFAVIADALLRRILEARARGGRINPVWMMSSEDFRRATRGQ